VGANHYAQRFAQFGELSTRVNSRSPAHAHCLRQSLDRSGPRFRGHEHVDSSVRHHNYAQDTRVGNAPFGVSGSRDAFIAGPIGTETSNLQRRDL
jgi:hypothetical protein